MTPAAVNEAASLLAQARRTGVLLDGLPAACRPSDADEALAIQDATIAALNETVAGWKVPLPLDGKTLHGAILQSRVIPSGGAIRAALVPLLGVEAEVAFRFDRDLAPRERPYTYEEVAAAVTAFPAIEIVDSRFRDYRGAPLIERIADCVSNGAFVQGAPQPRWREFDLTKIEARLELDGDGSYVAPGATRRATLAARGRTGERDAAARRRARGTGRHHRQLYRAQFCQAGATRQRGLRRLRIRDRAPGRLTSATSIHSLRSRTSAMKKLINKPADYVDEALDGLCSAFAGYRRTGRDDRVIARADGPVAGKVGVITGGGFGHLPVFAGYVGEGMLDACAVGNVFAGPPVDICADALRAADGRWGVVCVLGNYGGDRMSFAQACDEFVDEGGDAETVIVADDVASAPASEPASGAASRAWCSPSRWPAPAPRAAIRSTTVARIARAHGRTHALDRRRAVAMPHPRRGRAGVFGARRQDRDRHGHPRRAGRRGTRHRAPPTK